MYDDEVWEHAAAYRVTLWEQPARQPVPEPEPARPQRGSGQYRPFPGASTGWEQMTFELIGAQDVREAIEWAEAALASGEGRVSRRSRPAHGRAYVIYARLQREDRWLQVAGWPPVMPLPRGPLS